MIMTNLFPVRRRNHNSSVALFLPPASPITNSNSRRRRRRNRVAALSWFVLSSVMMMMLMLLLLLCLGGGSPERTVEGFFLPIPTTTKTKTTTTATTKIIIRSRIDSIRSPAAQLPFVGTTSAAAAAVANRQCPSSGTASGRKSSSTGNDYDDLGGGGGGGDERVYAYTSTVSPLPDTFRRRPEKKRSHNTNRPKQQKQQQQQQRPRRQQQRQQNGNKEAARVNGGDGGGDCGWQGKSMPKTIPKLSDVFEGNGNAVAAPQPKLPPRQPPKFKATTAAATATTTTTSKSPSPKRKHKQQQQQQQQQTQLPWRADYYTSRRTQQLIQNAAKQQQHTTTTTTQRAVAVLRTFLSSRPEHCNPANLVCALTLSAKLVVVNSSSSSSSSVAVAAQEECRALFFRTVRILQELVAEEMLSTRQLCNAAWAIGKHYDRDHRILPLAPEPAALSNEHMIGRAEKWSLLRDDDNNDVDDNNNDNGRNNGGGTAASGRNDPARQVDQVLDDIAVQLTRLLRQSKGRVAKEGELCMVSWAYGVLRPRLRPPGWEHQPQLGRTKLPKTTPTTRMTSTKQQESSPSPQQSKDRVTMASTATPSRRTSRTNSRKEFVRFEQWDQSSSKGFASTDDGESSNKKRLTDRLEPRSVTGDLFDAIGDALCQPFADATEETDKKAGGKVELVADRGQRLELCKWRELSNLAWAFASHGRSNSNEAEELLLSIGREAVWRLQEEDINESQPKAFLSRDLAQLIWSLGTLQSDNFRLAEILVELVDVVADSYKATFFQEWSCADIVQVAHSLAHARIDKGPLLRSIYAEASRRLDSASTSKRQGDRRTFQSWELSILLWAQARLYLTSEQGDMFPAFTRKVVHHLAKEIEESGKQSLEDIGIGQQEQANIAWSLTVLEEYGNPEATALLSVIFKEAASSCENEEMIQLEHAHQLWQAFFLLEQDCPDAVKDVPEWFRINLHEKWKIEKGRTKISSARHRSLSDLLGFMGVAHTNEHDEDIDVAIVLKSQASWTYQTTSENNPEGVQKVAVEFDGPHHFTRQIEPTLPPRTLGHTVLKYRLLKKQGWMVVRVPYYEFDRIPFWASMERQRYLQRLLKTHANLRFSTMDVSEYVAPKPNRNSRYE